MCIECFFNCNNSISLFFNYNGFISTSDNSGDYFSFESKLSLINNDSIIEGVCVFGSDPE